MTFQPALNTQKSPTPTKVTFYGQPIPSPAFSTPESTSTLIVNLDDQRSWTLGMSQRMMSKPLDYQKELLENSASFHTCPELIQGHEQTDRSCQKPTDQDEQENSSPSKKLKRK
jgi:hypothetical protein